MSVVQPNVLTPNDFSCLQEVDARLLKFQERYKEITKPFEWQFIRDDLSRLLVKLGAEPQPIPLCA
jgi:hypothetical protein